MTAVSASPTGSVIVLPESPLRDIYGVKFFLWDVEGASDHDLVLYDDLRTCLAQELSVHLERVSAMGCSGGNGGELGGGG